MTKKILILTALGLEFKAVRTFLTDIRPDNHPLTGSAYDRGRYTSDQIIYDVLLCETSAGNNRAADETSRALAYFQPDFAFFVGVAGGLKDAQLGDVIAATKVIGYDFGKDEAVFNPRNDVIPSSYRLEHLARRVARDHVWQKKISTSVDAAPEAFVAPIAAADKVVAATAAASFKIIKQYSSDAVAVEMEGIGFLVAARPYDVDSIVIRGISDLIDAKGEADASGSQPIAAAHAAAFTFGLIDELDKSIVRAPDLRDLEFRKKLVDKLVELYAQGPEQDDIWKRAGGDVHILINSASRKSQWFSAIERLSLGGGGKAITLKSLLDEINGDFPNATTDLV